MPWTVPPILLASAVYEPQNTCFFYEGSVPISGDLWPLFSSALPSFYAYVTLPK